MTTLHVYNRKLQALCNQDLTIPKIILYDEELNLFNSYDYVILSLHACVGFLAENNHTYTVCTTCALLAIDEDVYDLTKASSPQTREPA